MLGRSNGPLIGSTLGKRRNRWPDVNAVRSTVAHLLALVAVVQWIRGYVPQINRTNPAALQVINAEPVLHSTLAVKSDQAQLHNPSSQQTAGSWCRLPYTIPNWQGASVPVCDWSICAGREQLKPLSTPVNTKSRWSEADKALYLQQYRSKMIEGWLDEPQIRYVEALTQKQHQEEIFGAVAEVGVHHGMFFLPIAGFATREEPAYAIDLFEDQSKNVDASGRGSREILKQHLKDLGDLESSGVKLLAGNSMDLAAQSFVDMGLPLFRMISVDGGHTVENTLHDLMLASCLVRDGGIVILDDVPNPAWEGVLEALIHFSLGQDRMKLFLVGYNKAYFTTASHAQEYRSFTAAHQAVFTCHDYHLSRRMIAGSEFCYAGPDH